MLPQEFFEHGLPKRFFPVKKMLLEVRRMPLMTNSSGSEVIRAEKVVGISFLSQASVACIWPPKEVIQGSRKTM